MRISHLGYETFRRFPRIAKILADCNNNIIIDEVVLDDKWIDFYFEELLEHQIFIVDVYCNLNIMKSREILIIRIANNQIEIVYKNI